MFDQYLVTGATGFLGRAVAEELVRRRAQVHALVLRDDPYIHLLPKEVHTVIGDVCVESSLTDFFADADSRTCVIHCAGIVSVASRPGPRLYQVNVGGTWKVLRHCMEHDVGKMVYVSSVPVSYTHLPPAAGAAGRGRPKKIVKKLKFGVDSLAYI